MSRILTNVSRELTQVAWSASQKLMAPIYEFTDSLESDTSCPIFDELENLLSDAIAEPMLRLSQNLTMRAQQDREISLLKAKKVDLTLKKKKIRQIIDLLGGITSTLEDFVRNQGRLSGNWYDELFLKAKEVSKNNGEKSQETTASYAARWAKDEAAF